MNFLPSGLTNSQANEIAKMMFVAELVEIFMDFNNQKSGHTTWVAGHSDGEGLSQICSIMRFPTGHYDAYTSWVNKWLSRAQLGIVERIHRRQSRELRLFAAVSLLSKGPARLTIQQIIQIRFLYSHLAVPPRAEFLRTAVLECGNFIRIYLRSPTRIKQSPRRINQKNCQERH